MHLIFISALGFIFFLFFKITLQYREEHKFNEELTEYKIGFLDIYEKEESKNFEAFLLTIFTFIGVIIFL